MRYLYLEMRIMYIYIRNSDLPKLKLRQFISWEPYNFNKIKAVDRYDRWPFSERRK